MIRSAALIALLFASALFLLPGVLRADPYEALVALDDARVAAMKAGDRAALAAILSDDLRYAHSNGLVDDKESFVGLLASGETKYLGYEHVEREFTLASEGVALMSGRVRIRAETAKGAVDALLSYLAVWRMEDGAWRFLAWQSCRLPDEAAKP
jgi:hypothetical protein